MIIIIIIIIISSLISRTHHSSISKLDVSEDNEPGLSKLDVVLTFTLEVRNKFNSFSFFFFFSKFFFFFIF